MTTTYTPAITPKQKQVLDLLSQGTTPPEIAKKLKISTSGVYGHMRNMRNSGVRLPDGLAPAPAAAPDPEPIIPPAPVVASNGHTPDPTAALEAAISAGRERMAEIDDRIASLHAEAEQLQAEHTGLEETNAKYEQALAALA